MALYLITYDIAEKDKEEYEPLWNALRGMGAIRVLLSVWMVTGNRGSGAIYDRLNPLIRKSDRLLIQEVTRDVYWDRLEVSDSVFRELVTDNTRER